MSSKKSVLETVRDQDYVEYYLFPDYRNEVVSEEQFLKHLLQEVNSFTAKMCKNYIWHCDSFELRYRTSTAPVIISSTVENDLPPHFFGVSHFGDNIEDEWFIVHLLVQLSKAFPDLVIRVVDSDGEFLLIEAANFLPNWANPDTCCKRIYIHRGKLHIVAGQEDEEQEEIEVKEAVEYVRSNPSLTVASSAIQDAILKKIAGYPDKIASNLQRTNVFVPVSIAAILKHNCKLIAPAIRAFCNRDTVDLKACRAMKYFPPEDCVYANITFTRLLYAMIRHSKYLPDQKSGWKLPSPTTKEYRAHELGVKLACGFEILAWNGSKSWDVYKSKLQENNYFKGLIEGSLEYNSLLTKARERFEAESSRSNSVNHDILKLSRSLDMDAVRCDLSALPDDDSEEWMNVSADELDGMLNEQYEAQERTLLSNASNANDFSRKLEHFLTQTNSYEGVEYRQTNTKRDHRVDFDANQFANAVESILGMAIPEDDTWHEETDSDMDEYGEEAQSPLSDLNKSEMAEYIQTMDAELAQTTIGKSFLKADASDDFDDVEDFKSVDIDVNALKNILESYKAQMGEAGPSSTMLGPMGIHLDNSQQRSD